MTGKQQDTHPTEELLTAFALGHLEVEQARGIADHLAVCERCQEIVRAVPEDSVLRSLRPPATTPVPRSHLPGMPAGGGKDALAAARRPPSHTALGLEGAGDLEGVPDAAGGGEAESKQ